MRLNRIKLAGFKSFVDPTSIPLPSNLTGVVGPNGCGKSNVIDAVRWVMGELSARYLRGESMADVIFNGSGVRKPVGTASVELIFDNSDGRIGGAYASYSEISLKRVVDRDGSSAYYINGGRCRRRDITQLFLGTGLGSRSYAIIEQGMISRVIEAHAEDMRAFIEEAAGISLYKERRRETESRIADTRENLARLGDLVEEVDKQIRHLQRQANVAQRYRDLKAQERRLTAESLALRLRELDAAAAQQQRVMGERELAMQQALAEQRASEASIEAQRERQGQLAEALSRAQARYYELGAEVSRAEQAVQHRRELTERARQDLAQLTRSQQALSEQLGRDEAQRAALGEELAGLEPRAQEHRASEQAAAAQLAAAETRLADWQQRWEGLHRELSAAAQTMQVEATRIEQLEQRRERLQAQAVRLGGEADSLAAQSSAAELERLAAEESGEREQLEQRLEQLAQAGEAVRRLSGARHEAHEQLERLRREREQERAELLSLEALQKAALHAAHPRADAWLAGALPELSQRARLAESIEVDAGWERAVETVLGDYLEAIGVESLEPLATLAPQLDVGQLTFFDASPGARQSAAPPAAEPADSLAAHVHGPAAARSLLAGIRTCDSLATAIAARGALRPDESLITPGGEWLGACWLRVNRGGDGHAGVIEREQRLKELRERCRGIDARVASLESEVDDARTRLAAAELDRERLQVRTQEANQRHSELRGRVEALKARLEQAALRRERVSAEQAELAREAGETGESLARARGAHAEAGEALGRLEQQRRQFEEAREQCRAQLGSAREQAHAARTALQETLLRLESLRAAESAAAATLQRLARQLEELATQRATLERTQAEHSAPLEQLQRSLQERLAGRLSSESELTEARRCAEACDEQLRTLEHQRHAAEQRVTEARTAMEQARLAVQEARLRREALLEQFTATQCDPVQVLAELDPQAELAAWEERCAALRADIDRLGQVNLAAIDELAEQRERKGYLDRQFADVSDALQTLEQAMRRIDRETRTRFEDTFQRINAGLEEKFPRLFGGGHAYLQLVGDDPLAAGVTVMARPPGKRNSTIAQLSGGEKALTAIALVFAIFDLNPAPFCLLDEVDAPLDEHNVENFCNIVRDMSSRIQFIFITHNKVTMELASQLIGVTMAEAGVSRLVAVDVDEAVRLAAS